MNKPTYQLKDEILQYFIDYCKTTGRATVTYKSDDFKRNFGHYPIQDFMAQLLQDIQNDNLLVVKYYTHNQNNYTVTARGYDFMRAGGYSKQHANALKAEKRQNKEYKLVSWRVRWFWISQVLALVALALGIYAAFKD